MKETFLSTSGGLPGTFMPTGNCKNHKTILKCEWYVSDDFNRTLIRLLVLTLLWKHCSSHVAQQCADEPVLLLLVHWDCWGLSLTPKAVWLCCEPTLTALCRVSRPATEASHGSLLDMQNLSPTSDLWNQNLPFYKISRRFVCMLLFENHIGRALLPKTCYSSESLGEPRLVILESPRMEPGNFYLE